MFRTLPYSRNWSTAQRLVLIGLFVGLLALSAQIKFFLNSPVPYTQQVLVVLLAGTILGSRDGAIATATYLGLIWFGIPIDTGGLGASVLSGVTAGYLIGFIPAAWVAGFMVEHGANKMWLRVLAGLVGVAIIYACGLPFLKLSLDVSWSAAWSLSVAPFIAFDLLKVVVAAAFVETGRVLVLRNFPPLEDGQ